MNSRFHRKVGLLAVVICCNLLFAYDSPESDLENLKQKLGPDHPETIQSLRKLAAGYTSKDRPRAIALYKELLDALKKTYGAESLDVAKTQMQLADILLADRRPQDSEASFQESVAIQLKLFRAKRDVASLTILAYSCRQRNRFAAEEAVWSEMLAIQKNMLAPDHLYVANTLLNLAEVKRLRKQDMEYEVFLQEALAIQRKKLGPDDYRVSSTLFLLATQSERLGRQDAARQFLDQSLANQRQDGLSKRYRFMSLYKRANLEWNRGSRAPALVDLNQALDLAEELHKETLGDEQERAQAFAYQLVHVFNQMIAWQASIGDMEKTLSAIERSRARSLLDQINAAKLDLFDGMHQAEADALRQRQRDALSRIAELEKRMSELNDRNRLDSQNTDVEQRQIEDDAKLAREQYARAYAQIRKSSPVYRRVIAQGQQRISLDMLQKWVNEEDALFVEYVLHEGQPGYAFVVPAHDKPRLEKLTVSKEQAAVFGLAGTFSAHYLAKIFMTDPARPLLKLLSDPKRNDEARTRLASLWQILIPEPERKALRENKYKRLIIVPDALLSVFPFETLVADAVGEPEYLLDFGPPIEYSPSATIFFELAQRKEAAAGASANKEPVLSVAVANYDNSIADVGDAALALRSTRSAYRRCGGALSNLAGAKKECEWLVDNFQRESIPVKFLFNANASEAAVRAEIAGRRLLHLACHGLVDEAPGNLFGALALAPSSTSDPANDGFLTLAEIYGLDLKGCELALLSACETNLGKQQQGEGVWALSRGFLVAGARRVIASNWVVPDDATPSLVSYFCALVAQAEKEGRKPDYAAALHESKRWLRQHPQWSQPYYWAPLVLIGPH